MQTRDTVNVLECIRRSVTYPSADRDGMLQALHLRERTERGEEEDVASVALLSYRTVLICGLTVTTLYRMSDWSSHRLCIAFA